MTLKGALSFGFARLKNKVETAKLDSEIILSFVLNKPREFVFVHPEKNLTKTQELRFKKLIKQRVRHKPVAYITGKKEFYGIELFVDQRVLIPRPETEKLVEKTLDLINKLYAICHRPIRVLDIGTGSGSIAIAIAKNTKGPVQISAADICKKALKVAEKNARYHKANIKFIQSNLLENIRDCPDIIVANLPYITPVIYKKLSPEITKFEPPKALIAQRRDYFYEKLKDQLKNKGWKANLVFE